MVLSKKTVLFVHQAAEMYGSDKVLLYMVEGILASRQYSPIVILPSDGPLHGELVHRGVEVHFADVGKVSRAIATPTGFVKLMLSSLRGCYQLKKILKGRKVDIVHSNTLAVFTGALYALLFRVSHVWHVHEIILQPKAASKLFPRLANLFSDAVISNSTLTEKWLLDECSSVRTKSEVIFNGLPESPSVTDSERFAFRKSVGAGEDNLVVSLVGRINKWKGQELLVEAASILLKAGKLPVCKFVIVGDPAPGLEYLTSELKEKIRSARLEAYFEFVSFTSNVWAVWFGSDIAVVPSTQPEPFGMVAIEAMAAGLPVVAAAHGGLLDIVVDGETGALFNPRDAASLADALWRLMDDGALRRRLGNSGRMRQSSEFSISSQVESTVQAYENLLAR